MYLYIIPGHGLPVFCIFKKTVLLNMLKVPVRDPKEIDQLFDSISYSKGASIIRMLHNYIGDAVCTSSLKNIFLYYFDIIDKLV